jgi:translation elongation factor EF-Tu-like GTPase
MLHPWRCAELEAVFTSLDGIVRRGRPADGPFVMALGFCTIIRGYSTVAEGVVLQGHAQIGETLELLNEDRRESTPTSVLVAEVEGEPIDTIRADDEVGARMACLRRDGMLLTAAGAAPWLGRFEADVRVFDASEGSPGAALADRAQLSMHIRTNVRAARLSVDGVAASGRTSRVMITIDREIPLHTGARFRLCDGASLVAVGTVVGAMP